MLTTIRKKNNIHIYKNGIKLGYLFFFGKNDWGIQTKERTYCSRVLSLEELFREVFYFNIDDIPNIRNKIQIVYDYNESLRLANKLIIN